jgi:hypothetical protein
MEFEPAIIYDLPHTVVVNRDVAEIFGIPTPIQAGRSISKIYEL